MADRIPPPILSGPAYEEAITSRAINNGEVMHFYSWIITQKQQRKLMVTTS